MSDEEHPDSEFDHPEDKKRQRGTLGALIGILKKLKQAEIYRI